MFIKGYALPADKYADFKTACVKAGDGPVSVYEWGYGPCDDFMTVLKAAPTTTTFTATATTKPAPETGSSVTATFPLVAEAEGLYLVFENLLGGAVTFSNAAFVVPNAQQVPITIDAPQDLVYPPATVHMSAAVLYMGEGIAVDQAVVSFTAKQTTPSATARSTAVMVVSVDDFEADRLGCSFGFQFGWFKKQQPGQNVCQGADFSTTTTADGNILTLTGVMKAVTPQNAQEILSGETQIDPGFTYIQGDGDYSLASYPHGGEDYYVVIPNRLDTPIIIENLRVEYKAVTIENIFQTLMAHPAKLLASGPVVGIVVAVLLSVGAMVGGSFYMGRRKGFAAAVAAGEANKSPNMV